MKTQTRTAGPWQTGTCVGIGHVLCDSVHVDEVTIANCGALGSANAAFIVEACNAQQSPEVQS
jgi:hypothetical protein